MLWEKGATLLYHLEYRYDRAGNRTRRMVTKSPEAAVIEDFNYDALSRLVRVDENGSLRAHYKYDPAGNRLLKKRPPTLTSTGDGVVVDNDELYEYDASDELVAMNSTRFRWDRVGQLIEKDDPSQANPTRYEWNAAHRLSKVILPDLTSAEYRYNGDELRTWRREPSGAETNYYWVPSGILGLSQVLNETDGDGAPKASYVLGPNGLIAIVDGDGNERYYVFDALGSVLALTDETGAVTDTYAYDEYGVETSATGTSYNPMRYTGQQFDIDLGSYHLRMREYSPGLASFTSRDPLLLTTRYRYAAGNPARWTDPNGLNPAVPIILGGAAITAEEIASAFGLTFLGCMAVPNCRSAVMEALSELAGKFLIFCRLVSQSVENLGGGSKWLWWRREPCMSIICVYSCTDGSTRVSSAPLWGGECKKFYSTVF
jgi:RHS repeat-associated protein